VPNNAGDVQSGLDLETTGLFDGDFSPISTIGFSLSNASVSPLTHICFLTIVLSLKIFPLHRENNNKSFGKTIYIFLLSNSPIQQD
jgi:hypothetical protein